MMLRGRLFYAPESQLSNDSSPKIVVIVPIWLYDKAAVEIYRERSKERRFAVIIPIYRRQNVRPDRLGGRYDLKLPTADPADPIIS
ncbi:hypothetical protein PUN28_019355 [Cardiocondyla obscurior]|uniref:Uncharacterized protein n=1 Tax=Cardiocondyla obscurior TaxID=286306 RepID=A0AAW2EF14_9HYME